MQVKRKCLTFLIVTILMVSFCYFDVNIVPMAGASPSYENFNTYEEVDPNSHIEKTATHIDFNAYENEEAYVYKDKGEGYFTNFEHLVDVKDTHIGEAVAGGFWAVSNDLDDFNGLETTGKTALVVFFYDSTTDVNRRIWLREIYGSSHYDDSYAPFTFGMTYYLRINKEGTAFSCEIYGSADDRANSENAIASLGVTLQADHSFRYIFGAITYDVQEAVQTDVDVDNLDLKGPLENTVLLKSPSHEATETSWSINFVFNATFVDTIQNASLHLENITSVPTAISWTTHHWNTSSVENNTEETISYDFSANGEGSYKWNIEVFNATQGFYAISNRTLNVDQPPRYKNVDSNSTFCEEGGSILLYGEAFDGLGLDWAWLWTNETGGIGHNYTEEGEFQEKWDSGNIISSTNPDVSRNVIVDGNYLYGVTNYGKAFAVYNISDIDSPVQESLITLNYGGIDLRKKGNYVFASCTMGITVIDVSDPENPSQVKQVSMGSAVHGMFLVGNYLYCCQHLIDKFVILNVTDPTNPIEEGSLSGGPYFDGPHDVYVNGNYAYVTNYMAGIGDYGITVVNVSDVESPSTVIGVDTNEKHSGITKSGNYIYAGSHSPSDELTIYDVSSPSSPVFIGKFFSDEELSFAYWMDWWNGFLVSTSKKTGAKGIRLIDVTDPSYPHIVARKTIATYGVACVCVDSDRIFASCNDQVDSNYWWKIKSFSVEASPYNSPMDMNEIPNQWLWTNFTWSNISIATGTKIQWRIFLNDTYGNENCTSLNTFTIGKSPYLFYDDFEKGDFSLWDKGGDYPCSDHDIQSSVKYEGTYASWMNGTANDHHRCEKNVTLTTESCVHLQFYVRIDEAPSGPASGFVYLAGLGDTTDTAEVMVCLNTTSMNFGLMTLHDASHYTESSMTATLQTWYLIDVYVIVEESVYLFVDGTKEVSKIESESLDAISNVMMIYELGTGGGWSGNHVIYHDNVLVDDVMFKEAGPVGPFGPYDHRVEVNVRLNGERLKGANVTVEGGPDNKLKWGLTDVFGKFIFKLKTGSYEIVASFEQYRKPKSVYVSRHMTVSIDLTEEDIISPDVIPEDVKDFFEEWLSWVKLPELDLTTETLLVFILPLIVLVAYAVKKVSEGPKRKWKYSYLK